MGITNDIKNEIMLINEEFMSEAEDKYNFWEEHVKYVLQEALALAAKYNADAEIVELAAMLHDVALMARVGTRKEHHVNGAEIAENMLSKYNYPQDKTQKVKTCIINHRSSKNSTNIEDVCVADADILAHFDNIAMIFSNILNRNKHDNITLPELRSNIKKAFDKDYDDLSEETKKHFGDRYKTICQIVFGV